MRSGTPSALAFEEAGGEFLDWYGYEPALQDFSQPTAALLNVTRSRERHQRLAANLGVPVQFPEARHREDVDMIFVVAFDSQPGRLLASQLRFFGAGDIPVYATSKIFDPARTTRDNDLNGFIFADTPALLSPDNDASTARDDVQTYWPQRMSQLRFYGMGVDAYALIAPLYANESASLVAARHVGRSVARCARTRPASLAARAVPQRTPSTAGRSESAADRLERLIGQR